MAKISANNLNESDTIASRISQLIGEESVSSFAKRCGISESLIRKYLNGSQPSAQNLVLISNATGCAIDWLAAGKPPIFRADSTNLNIESDDIDSDEIWILKTYREANLDQKHAVKMLLKAIENPGGLAWFKVGESISMIANFFKKNKNKGES